MVQASRLQRAAETAAPQMRKLFFLRDLDGFVDSGGDPAARGHRLVELVEVELPEELKEAFSEEEWKRSVERQRQSMIDLGQNPTVEAFLSVLFYV